MRMDKVSLTNGYVFSFDCIYRHCEFVAVLKSRLDKSALEYGHKLYPEIYSVLGLVLADFGVLLLN